MKEPKCIGLGADRDTSIVYSSVRLRMLTGKAVPLEKYVGATAPTKPAPKTKRTAG